ncbi:MAG: carboxypeptidase-like regulatory domain-containing protein [Ignavibacteria bacterium]|nr:carboxypeptidase-like regulatory domain-containing protein [Ignavibacteria bacterium]
MNSIIISGKIQDIKGKGIGNASIYFIDSPVSMPEIALLTDEVGKFTLSVPVKGNYKIGISADGFISNEIEFNLQKNDVDIKVILEK